VQAVLTHAAHRAAVPEDLRGHAHGSQHLTILPKISGGRSMLGVRINRAGTSGAASAKGVTIPLLCYILCC